MDGGRAYDDAGECLNHKGGEGQSSHFWNYSVGFLSETIRCFILF